MTKRSIGFAFTCNNYTEEHEQKIKDLEYTYLVYGKEVAPTTGTPHLQGYIHFPNQRSVKKLRKMLPGFSIDAARGTAQQNRVYCTKTNIAFEGGELPENKSFEDGVAPAQGKRTDLDHFVAEVRGGRSVASVMLERPALFHQYGRTLQAVEEERLRTQYRTGFMTEGIWYWGPSGVGKSHHAFKNFTPDNTYVYPYDGDWWDDYRGQEVVIFNDYRGQLPMAFMLNMLDKWPFTVRRRARPPLPFVSKTVIFTAPLPPKEYYFISPEDFAQLERRLSVVHFAERAPDEQPSEASEERSGSAADTLPGGAERSEARASEASHPLEDSDTEVASEEVDEVDPTSELEDVDIEN